MVDIAYTHPDGRLERIRKVSPLQTRRGAEQYERALLQALVDGTYDKKEEKNEIPTLAKFADEFIENYARANNKPSELSGKKTAFRLHLVPAFGRLRLNEIGPREIEKFKGQKINEGYKSHTINNWLTMLRRTLAVAAEWGHIDHVPPIKWLKVPEPAFDFLDFAESERLVAGADGMWKTMIFVALKTGLRHGELLALRWEDVDLVTGRLRVCQSVARGIVGTPKNGRTREIPLSEDTLRALKAHRHLRGEFVFCTEEGKIIPRGATKWPLRRACRKAGLRHIGWHCLRHTFASHLVMRGAPMKAVQELLGHTTMEMTMRYSHLSPDVRRDVVLLLDQARDKGNLAATREVANTN
jgi:integrase